jgi:hypothetical protein
VLAARALDLGGQILDHRHVIWAVPEYYMIVLLSSALLLAIHL